MYIKDGPTVVWLTKVLEDWPKYIMADPCTLRLTQVYWLSGVPWGLPKCFMAKPSTYEQTQEFHGWSKYLQADQGVSWLTQVPLG